MKKRAFAWMVLLACETSFAVIYAKWLAPHLAAQHLELETAGPLWAVVLFSTAVIAVCVRAAAKKKLAVNVLAVLMSLLALSILLYGIGLHTECPVCTSPLF